MACKSLLVAVVLCAAVLALSQPAQARDLLVDRVVSNCKEYGEAAHTHPARTVLLLLLPA